MPPLLGFQNGAFKQGALPNTDPVTFQPGNKIGDSAFLGSAFHQRGRQHIGMRWDFPPFQESQPGAWATPNTVRSLVRNDDNGNPITKYLDGSYVAIDLEEGVTALGGDWYDDNFTIGASGSFVLGTQFFLPADSWSFITAAEYYGTPNLLLPNYTIAVAKWGNNSFWMRTDRPISAGTFKKDTVGFFSSGWTINNNIGGQMNFIVSAIDRSGFVDITPTPPFISSPANALRGLPQYDTTALLGSKIPWYPTIIVSAVPDLGFAAAFNKIPDADRAVGYNAIWAN